MSFLLNSFAGIFRDRHRLRHRSRGKSVRDGWYGSEFELVNGLFLVVRLYRGLDKVKYFLGTAGWTVPKQHGALFPLTAEGRKVSQLERYASQLRCVEINSSFHRPHRRITWERWAATTPPGFRFSVKMSKTVTHTAKLGPILVQLPPKLIFDEGVAREFFVTLRELHAGAVVVEPRHASWFSAPSERLLQSFDVARAAADPPKGSERAARPGGWPGLSYWRLHGSPRTYYSEYDQHWLHAFAERLETHNRPSAPSAIWVIFDNTALGHASANVVALQNLLCREI